MRVRVRVRARARVRVRARVRIRARVRVRPGTVSSMRGDMVEIWGRYGGDIGEI